MPPARQWPKLSLALIGWLIFARVLLSVSANAAQKRLLLDRAGVYHTWILTYAFMLLPAVLVSATRWRHPGASFWSDIALAGALDAFGNLAMIAALRVTDLSVFGPLNALRPILALLFGWLFLRETPRPLGFAGVVITVLGGIVLFAERAENSSVRIQEAIRAVSLRVTGLSLGVIGAVFLKRAAAHASAELTVSAWIASGLIVLLGAAFVRRRDDLKSLGASMTAHGRWLLLHSLLFLIMQWVTIKIFSATLLAYSFVYFQLGMILQVITGKLFFNERHFARRLLASAIMAAGSILVLWKG